MSSHQFQMLHKVGHARDGSGSPSRQACPLEQGPHLFLGELSRNGLSERRRMDHVTVTDARRQAYGSWAFEDVEVDDIVPGQNPEVDCLVEQIAKALQVRAGAYHQEWCFVACEADNTSAEAIRA